MKNQQIRLRLPADIALELRALPITVRNQLIAIMLRAQLSKLDLQALLEMRKELSNLGTLINQSLRTSWGQETDHKAVSTVVTKLKTLFSS